MGSNGVGIHQGWDPFGIGSIWDGFHLGWDPLGMGSTPDGIHGVDRMGIHFCRNPTKHRGAEVHRRAPHQGVTHITFLSEAPNSPFFHPNSALNSLTPTGAPDGDPQKRRPNSHRRHYCP